MNFLEVAPVILGGGTILASLIAAGVGIYGAIVSSKTARRVAEMNAELTSQLKDREYIAAFYQEVAKKQIKLYEDLLDLVADFYTAQAFYEGAKTEGPLYTADALRDFRVRVDALFKHIFLLSEDTREMYRVFRLAIYDLVSDAGAEGLNLTERERRGVVSLAAELHKKLMEEFYLCHAKPPMMR